MTYSYPDNSTNESLYNAFISIVDNLNSAILVQRWQDMPVEILPLKQSVTTVGERAFIRATGDLELDWPPNASDMIAAFVTYVILNDSDPSAVVALSFHANYNESSVNIPIGDCAIVEICFISEDQATVLRTTSVTIV